MTKVGGEQTFGNEKIYDLEGQDVGWLLHVNVELTLNNDCIKRKITKSWELNFSVNERNQEVVRCCG